MFTIKYLHLYFPIKYYESLFLQRYVPGLDQIYYLSRVSSVNINDLIAVADNNIKMALSCILDMNKLTFSCLRGISNTRVPSHPLKVCLCQGDNMAPSATLLYHPVTWLVIIIQGGSYTLLQLHHSDSRLKDCFPRDPHSTSIINHYCLSL